MELLICTTESNLLKNKTVKLTKIDECLYRCSNTGYDFIDADNDIDYIIETKGENNVYRVHLFTMIDDELHFIDRCVVVDTNLNLITNLKNNS